MTATAGLDGQGKSRDVRRFRAGIGAFHGAVLVLAAALGLAGIGFIVHRCQCGRRIGSDTPGRESDGGVAPREDTLRDPAPAHSAGVQPSAGVNQRMGDDLSLVVRRLVAAEVIDVPAGGLDQHGNPVVIRDGRRTDLESGLPYEIWLKSPIMELVLLPAGEFFMGSPESEENRDLDESKPTASKVYPGFYLGKYEVTEAQWDSVLCPGFTGCHKGPALPQSVISWYDCHRYLAALNKRAEREGPPLFRLPTELEWEYGCRAGSRTRFSSGDSTSSLLAVGWFDENSNGASHPVGKKAPNAWGLYDMHGNVWEWCEDAWMDEDSSDLLPRDHTRQEDHELRVLRGGSWNLFPRCCRSANRSGSNPRIRSLEIGLRIVLYITR
jgi:formylglycine-generating enzyme required for sulfatase activity